MPCVVDHTALAADPTRFDVLPHEPARATWVFPWGEVHVVRNCPACGSTLARVLVPGEPVEMSAIDDDPSRGLQIPDGVGVAADGHGEPRGGD